MRKRLILLTAVLFIFSVFTIANTISANSSPKVSIIIDDFGGNVGGVDSFFQSGIPITVAIMPFMENTKAQAEQAHNNGLEVMIHLPLQPKNGKRSWLGPNAITKDLSEEEIRKRVEMAIEDVPHAKGVNNHMGSLIVEDEKIMRVILSVIKSHNLYIVDSGTSSKSVIPRLAEEMEIPWSKRDTFLDDTFSSSSHVYKQVEKLANVAKTKGTAIGIGHVGVKGLETVQGVKQGMNDFFTSSHIEVVPVSELLKPSIEDKPGEFWQY